MADLWVILAILAFFGLCVAFVYGCDRIIGPDDDSDLDSDPSVGAEDLVAEVIR